jgi:hypothetical protein
MLGECTLKKVQVMNREANVDPAEPSFLSTENTESFMLGGIKLLRFDLHKLLCPICG